MIEVIAKKLMGRLKIIEKKIKSNAEFIEPRPYTSRSFDVLVSGCRMVSNGNKEKALEREGSALTQVHNDQCYPYFQESYGCLVCCKECPFSCRDFRVYKKAFDRNQRKIIKRNRR